MEPTIISPDGTRLATRTSGSGTPLLLVHGGTGSKDSWGFVAPQLEPHHTVHVYDRRGRGDSDSGSEGYGLAAEVDDLLAVIDACAAPPHLVAHSFGAACALEAVANGATLASLTVYEPPVHLERAGAELAETRKHLADGDASRALEVFLPMAGSPVEEVGFLQSMPDVWSSFVEVAAATLDRELVALLELDWDPARYAAFDRPVLVLSGELTQAPVYATPSELQAAFPQAEVHTFPGQHHVAMATDPAAFAAAILDFIRRIPG